MFVPCLHQPMPDGIQQFQYWKLAIELQGLVDRFDEVGGVVAISTAREVGGGPETSILQEEVVSKVIR